MLNSQKLEYMIIKANFSVNCSWSWIPRPLHLVLYSNVNVLQNNTRHLIKHWHYPLHLAVAQWQLVNPQNSVCMPLMDPSLHLNKVWMRDSCCLSLDGLCLCLSLDTWSSSACQLYKHNYQTTGPDSLSTLFVSIYAPWLLAAMDSWTQDCHLPKESRNTH